MLRDTSLWDDWNVRLVSTHSNGSMFSRLWMFAVALCQFVHEMTLRRPDIVHLHTAAYGSFFRKATLAWISKSFRVPVVLHMHGADFHIFFADAPRPIQWLIRSTLERMDAVVALGDAWACRLRRIAPRSTIVVIANAVRPGKPVSHHAAGTVKVTFLGEIGDRKGTFTLIEAWAHVLADGDGRLARLTVAGDGEVDRARQLIAEVDVADSVELLGWISSSEVSRLLADTQVLVLPSRDEGQPMAILEAMARGICVIAGNVGGIPELLCDGCGILVEPDDVDGLASTISSVIGDAALRSSFGSRARARIEKHFDLDVVSRRFDDLYRELAR